MSFLRRALLGRFCGSRRHGGRARFGARPAPLSFPSSFLLRTLFSEPSRSIASPAELPSEFSSSLGRVDLVHLGQQPEKGSSLHPKGPRGPAKRPARVARRFTARGLPRLDHPER